MQNNHEPAVSDTTPLDAIAVEGAFPTNIDPAIVDLDFDPKNPRFLDAFDGMEQADAEAIRRMVEEENIHELVGSIGQQGYFPGEPLLVTPNRERPGRFIVVEGNRRLAALRVLSGLVPDSHLPESLVQAVREAEHKPLQVKCLSFSERRDILKYLGFRHISGPRRWEPLSKARYLADLISNFYTDLSFDAQLRALAKDIGSKPAYVAQLLTALRLYDQAKASNYYDLQRLSERDISFSLITTALSYNNIVQFLGIQSRGDASLQGLDENHLKDLLSWMFAQDQKGDTVLGESRRLKLLAAVVASSTATAELRKKGDLDQAYIHTSGPAEALTKLLDAADRSLEDCSTMMARDVALDESHLTQIKRVLKMAENLELLIQKGLRERQRAEASRNA